MEVCKLSASCIQLSKSSSANSRRRLTTLQRSKSDQPSTVKERKLEFGIEITHRQFPQQSSWLDCATHLAETLTNNTSIPVVAEDTNATIANLTNGVPQYSTWVIAEDASVEFADEEHTTGITHLGFELQSPVLQFNTPDSLKQIQDLLHVLNSFFKIRLNQSCGMHVHVGHGTKGFSAPVLQNLMGALWVFEPHIEKLHATSRLSNWYCRGLRNGSRFGRDVAKGSMNGIVLDHILNPEMDINSVVKTWGPREASMGSAYSVSRLKKPFPYGLKRTIEFRQHAGTMDVLDICHWVSFTGTLVAWAKTVDDRKVGKFLSDRINLQQDQLRLVELFKEIGLRSDTKNFYVDRLKEYLWNRPM